MSAEIQPLLDDVIQVIFRSTPISRHLADSISRNVRMHLREVLHKTLPDLPSPVEESLFPQTSLYSERITCSTPPKGGGVVLECTIEIENIPPPSPSMPPARQSIFPRISQTLHGHELRYQGVVFTCTVVPAHDLGQYFTRCREHWVAAGCRAAVPSRAARPVPVPIVFTLGLAKDPAPAPAPAPAGASGNRMGLKGSTIRAASPRPAGGLHVGREAKAPMPTEAQLDEEALRLEGTVSFLPPWPVPPGALPPAADAAPTEAPKAAGPGTLSAAVERPKGPDRPGRSMPPHAALPRDQEIDEVTDGEQALLRGHSPVRTSDSEPTSDADWPPVAEEAERDGRHPSRRGHRRYHSRHQEHPERQEHQHDSRSLSCRPSAPAAEKAGALPSSSPSPPDDAGQGGGQPSQEGAGCLVIDLAATAPGDGDPAADVPPPPPPSPHSRHHHRGHRESHHGHRESHHGHGHDHKHGQAHSSHSHGPRQGHGTGHGKGHGTGHGTGHGKGHGKGNSRSFSRGGRGAAEAGPNPNPNPSPLAGSSAGCPLAARAAPREVARPDPDAVRAFFERFGPVRRLVISLSRAHPLHPARLQAIEAPHAPTARSIRGAAGGSTAGVGPIGLGVGAAGEEGDEEEGLHFDVAVQWAGHEGLQAAWRHLSGRVLCRGAQRALGRIEVLVDTGLYFAPAMARYRARALGAQAALVSQRVEQLQRARHRQQRAQRLALRRARKPLKAAERSLMRVEDARAAALRQPSPAPLSPAQPSLQVVPPPGAWLGIGSITGWASDQPSTSPGARDDVLSLPQAERERLLAVAEGLLMEAEEAAGRRLAAWEAQERALEALERDLMHDEDAASAALEAHLREALLLKLRAKKPRAPADETQTGAGAGAGDAPTSGLQSRRRGAAARGPRVARAQASPEPLAPPQWARPDGTGGPGSGPAAPGGPEGRPRKQPRGPQPQQPFGPPGEGRRVRSRIAPAGS
ncbi:hypothetical protein PAPYR_3507 [Paratrimastix pyriformis]|uniref:RRM domain-containing protein n=1 Tax=Paratrimastix pyriformis TaxID=342808 RepID=A0ABQ8USF1_9EUKA|nr:hypothetical protein PAPYR_3507 [Paratrimastix pyriformis]